MKDKRNVDLLNNIIIYSTIRLVVCLIFNRNTNICLIHIYQHFWITKIFINIEIAEGNKFNKTRIIIVLIRYYQATNTMSTLQGIVPKKTKLSIRNRACLVFRLICFLNSLTRDISRNRKQEKSPCWIIVVCSVYYNNRNSFIKNLM